MFALEPLWILFHLCLFLSFIDKPQEGRVAWVDDEPALLASYFVWRRGAGHSWRTQDADGRQYSKVPSGLPGIILLVGRTWLCYSYHKLLRLPWGSFALRFAYYFPLVCSLTLFISRVLLILFFTLARFFSSVGHIPCGEARRFFSLFFFLFLFRFIFLSCGNLFILQNIDRMLVYEKLNRHICTYACTRY